VDFAGNWSGKQPDVACDLRALPFPDECADEIHAIHVLEHFHRWEVGPVLLEWRRVLKPDGLLVLEMPNLNNILHAFQTYVTDRVMTFHGLYGDPSYKDPAMVHKWCYSYDEIKFVVSKAGFKVRFAVPQFHFPARDMRVEARKYVPEQLHGTEAGHQGFPA
jgi:predicted SAM-dependent methyltransferase